MPIERREVNGWLILSSAAIIRLRFLEQAMASVDQPEIDPKMSDLATAIRTIIILLIAWGIVFFRGEHKSIQALSRHNLFFLVISGLATGLSWIFYFKALQLGKVS